MAPEVIQQGYAGASYGRKADIWSVGAVIIEMLTGKPPFHSLAPVTALFKIGSSPAVPPTPTGVSPNLADVLRLCFQRDPKARPAADELLRHPFFQEDEEVPISAAKSPSISASRPSESSTQAASPTSSSPSSSKKRSKPRDKDKDKDKEKEKEVRTKKRRSKQLKTSQIVDSLARQQQDSAASSPRGTANAADSSAKEDSEASQDALNSSDGGFIPQSELAKSPQSERVSLGSDSDINSIISFLREKIKQEEHEDVFKL